MLEAREDTFKSLKNQTTQRLYSPAYNCFTVTMNDVSAALPPQVELLARSPSNGKGAEISPKLDWSDYDRDDPMV